MESSHCAHSPLTEESFRVDGMVLILCNMSKVGPTFWTVSITYTNSSISAPIACTVWPLMISPSPPHKHKKAKREKDLYVNREKRKGSSCLLNFAALTLQLVHCVRKIRPVQNMVPSVPVREQDNFVQCWFPFLWCCGKQVSTLPAQWFTRVSTKRAVPNGEK